MSVKYQKFEKKQLRSDDDILLKNFSKCTNFAVSVSNFKSRVSEFLMKSRSRRLRSRLHHWSWVVTCSQCRGKG